MKKITLQRSNIILISYLLIWLISGVIYWQLAQRTNGSAFKFQEDILLSTKSKEFAQTFKTNVEEKYIIALFENYNDKDQVITRGKDPINSYTYIIGNDGMKNIDYVWAEYYYMDLLNKQFNYFSYDLMDIEKIIGNYKYAKIKLEYCKIPERKINRINRNQYLELGKEYSDYVEKKKTYYIWVKAEDFEEDLAIMDQNIERYFPILESKRLLLASVNYLGKEYKLVQAYENGYFNYSILDFLYFSAVTITTLGYGDILPNSTSVRVVVTVETVIGIILIGLFVSQKFSEITKSNRNK